MHESTERVIYKIAGTPVKTHGLVLPLLLIILIGRCGILISEGLPWIDSLIFVAVVFALLALSNYLHQLTHAVVANLLDTELHEMRVMSCSGHLETWGEPEQRWRLAAIWASAPVTNLLLGWFLLEAKNVVASESPTMLMVAQLVMFAGYLNILYGAVQLIPARPFDGGHAMIRVIEHTSRDYLAGLRLALWSGWAFLIVIAACFVVMPLSGNPLVVLGASTSVSQSVVVGLLVLVPLAMGIRQVGWELRYLRIIALIEPELVVGVPVAATPQTLVSELDADIKDPRAAVLVFTDNRRLSGFVHRDVLAAVPPELHASTRVESLMEPCRDGSIVSPDYSIKDMLDRLHSYDGHHQSLFIVAEGHQIYGVVWSADVVAEVRRLMVMR